MLVLRRPTLEDRQTIENMFVEFEKHASSTDGFWFQTETFDYVTWLEQCNDAESGLGLREGAVPYIQMVSFDSHGEAIGFVNLRLRLNDRLFEKGGHIGYSIRPSQRRKGLAKEQLRLALAECLSKNISSALITCHETNEGSRRTILDCGGVLEDVRQGTERYWIDLEA